jgi:DHA2 family multidrug resistance protein-like MFS transporter
MGLGVAVGTMTAPALARRMAPTTAIAAGLALSVPGCLLLTRIDGAGGLPIVMVGIAVLALGTGPLFALGTGLVIGSVPPERAGSAASMSETGNYFGSSLGMGLLGAIAASVYRAHMAHAGIPAAAGQTLADAITAGRHLPPAQAAALLHTAGDAFNAGVSIIGLIAAVTFGALAVLIATTRRTSQTHEAAVESLEAKYADALL